MAAGNCLTKKSMHQASLLRNLESFGLLNTENGETTDDKNRMQCDSYLDLGSEVFWGVWGAGEWWNAKVEQVVIDVLATGSAYRISNALIINGHPGYLYNFLSRSSTSCTYDAYKVKAKPGYKFYMTATPFSMVPYDARALWPIVESTIVSPFEPKYSAKGLEKLFHDKLGGDL
ncbi:unnamed protein product [Sphagnum compactum]